VLIRYQLESLHKKVYTTDTLLSSFLGKATRYHSLTTRGVAAALGSRKAMRPPPTSLGGREGTRWGLHPFCPTPGKSDALRFGVGRFPQSRAQPENGDWTVAGAVPNICEAGLCRKARTREGGVLP
jgi:hypothetical protein